MKSLGLIGVGAFGEFMLPHLAPHFEVTLHDPGRDLSRLAKDYGCNIASLQEAAGADIVLLAMPVQFLEEVARGIAPRLKDGALVIDVCSVKTQPCEIMAKVLPESVEILGSHPLFGPQSGKGGIAGLKISLCTVRGQRLDCVKSFLEKELQLEVIVTTPEEHDRQMAYVQGLTHLISKILVEMDLPPMQQTTSTFDLMMSMVESVRYDSDLLFRAIENRNPYVAHTKDRFFDSSRKIEEMLARQRS